MLASYTNELSLIQHLQQEKDYAPCMTKPKQQGLGDAIKAKVAELDTTLDRASVDLGLAPNALSRWNTATKPFGPKSLLALDRYTRARSGHKHASSARLWLGPKGPLTRSGVAQMIERRCNRAGISPIHAHQFRHTWAHNWKSEGGRDEDLMQLAGWSSPAMLRRYGASLADQRAKEAYRARLPGERL